jgi:hypothetical protein
MGGLAIPIFNMLRELKPWQPMHAIYWSGSQP